MSVSRLTAGRAVLTVVTTLTLTACDGDSDGPGSTVSAETREEVAVTNADIAFAAYEDSYITAVDLSDALTEFVADPTEDNFSAAKQAWLDSREPYGQTEVYRFREGPIDALLPDGTLGQEGDGPEGNINAWPLGEALIDYVANNVDGDEGPEIPDSTSGINGNIIADTTIPITAETIRDAFELGGDERNVSSGYHAPG